MKTAEEIKSARSKRRPRLQGVELVPIPAPRASTRCCSRAATRCRVASFLRDDPELALRLLLQRTGVDWPDKEISEKKVKVTKVRRRVERRDVVEETVKRIEPGYLEAVYHLFSMKHEARSRSVLRMRTVNRTDQVICPRSRRSGAARSFRSARSSTSTASSSRPSRPAPHPDVG
jgi:NADH-quinone oxidoreductase subunit C